MLFEEDKKIERKSKRKTIYCNLFKCNNKKNVMKTQNTLFYFP